MDASCCFGGWPRTCWLRSRVGSAGGCGGPASVRWQSGAAGGGMRNVLTREPTVDVH